MTMNKFIDLTLPQQAALVLIALLDDIANEKRTIAELEYHIHGLYNILSAAWQVPDQEVEAVIAAVATYGVEMLPAYPKEIANDGTDDQADGTK